MSKISAIDLFCGAGGLSHGLMKSKINIIAGFDIDESCRYAYEENNSGAKFFSKDVSEIKAADILKLYPKGDIKLLAGCAPCQPFSTYSNGRDVKSDEKWPLLYAFSRLIQQVSPELVTMENVPDVTKHKVYKDFVSELKNLGYHVWADNVYCPDYGIPQGRTRHVLLASKFGEIEIINPIRKPENYATVRDVIGHFPRIIAGGQHKSDPLHICAGLSDLNLERIRHSKPGGTWKDWPARLIANCHKKDSGKTYVGVYARMAWDAPSPTMTTQCFGFGNGRFGHPEQDRAISLREAAVLQSFPISYKFLPSTGKIPLARLGKMIGNAVPVSLGLAIGRSLIRHVG